MGSGLSVMGILVLLYAGVCATYYLLQERLIFVRSDLSDGYRFKFQYPFEERYVKADDGNALHALYFPVEDGTPKGVVLYFHGNTGTLRRWGRRAPRFTRQGWAVLMPDPRGYGKSRGKLSEAALLADAWTWYSELCKDWRKGTLCSTGGRSAVDGPSLRPAEASPNCSYWNHPSVGSWMPRAITSVGCHTGFCCGTPSTTASGYRPCDAPFTSSMVRRTRWSHSPAPSVCIRVSRATGNAS
ncbi:MAG: alpha/beta hydrolase [Flavobacteriales bacterium]|nr:alpha/beta hydrolase [Flavobacteriales bacterium]